MRFMLERTSAYGNDIGLPNKLKKELNYSCTQTNPPYYDHYININSLDQLLNLLKKVDQIIIWGGKTKEPLIEIYDDHRE